MSRPFTVLLDMDSTVYDLITPTLKWINAKYGKNLAPQDISVWHWDKVHGVDPYEFWSQEGTFSKLEPFPGAEEAIKTVHDWGIRQVFFSTIVAKHSAWEKLDSVNFYFPYIGYKDVLLTGGNKDFLVGDVLVDDGPHNIEAFHKAGGYAILANLQKAPYCESKYSDMELTNWGDYPRIIKSVKAQLDGLGRVKRSLLV